ncbi:MAG: glycosyltransferase [Desulfovibrionaceae bacterium]
MSADPKSPAPTPPEAPTPRPPRVLYCLANYVSHRQAGQANMTALAAAGVELTDDPARADLAVIHDEPPFFAQYMKRLRGLPVVAYCVWEMDPLPDAYALPLAIAEEVWTASEFSRSLLAARLPRVAVVPHVVQRPRVSAADLAWMRRRLGMGDEREYWFYAVMDALTARKNIGALLEAFCRVRAMHPRARLAVKQYRADWPGLAAVPGVVSIPEFLSDGRMGALHAACHCLVSPHRAEAWGLSLSQAMAFGRTVVATGYSGNLDYMDDSCALLVRHRVREVTSDELASSSAWFQPGMRWADPDVDHLTECMQRALLGSAAGPVAGLPEDLGARAQRSVARFNPKAVGEIMLGRIRTLLAERRAWGE